MEIDLDKLAADLGKKNADSMQKMFEAARADDQKAATELQAKLLNELGADSPHIKAMQSQLDKISTDIKTANQQNITIKSFRQSLRDQEVGRKCAELMGATDQKSTFRIEIPLDLDQKLASPMTNAGNLSGGLPKPNWIPGVSKTPDEAPFLSSLIPVFGTTSNTVYYINRTARTLAAAAVTPGNALPQNDYTYAGASAAIVDYGAHTKIHQNMLDDNDFVAGQLDAELPWDVLHVLDAAILSGILSGATAFSAAGKPYSNAVVEANNYDALRYAIRQARSSKFAPDTILVNGDDYAMMETSKTSTGEYTTPAWVSFTNGLMRISGVPVYPNETITSGSYAVCTLNRTYLAMRQNLVMEFGLDSNDYTLRMITARAYVRAAYVKSTQANLGFITATFADTRSALTI